MTDNGSEETFADSRSDASPQKRRQLFNLPTVLGAVIVVGLFLGLTVVPMPFVVESPGPTVDVGSHYRDQPILDISGTDPDTGQSLQLDDVRDDSQGGLRLVTVSEAGGPGRSLSAIDLVLSWLDSRTTIRPYDEVYAPELTQEQLDEYGKAQMANSQSAAVIAALEHLGWKVPARVSIQGASPGSDAEEKVQEGDVFVSITDGDGVVHPVDSAAVPFRVMRATPQGTAITIQVERDGKTIDIPIVTSEPPPGEEGSKMGVLLSPDVTMPIEVDISLENIMGPSAGMIFALGIIDRMTPGDQTGGHTIAGTGTLSYDGVVGPIGGLKQKLWAAQRDGASHFLLPEENCADIVGESIPEDLQLVVVNTLDEATEALADIAADRDSDLATCTLS